MKVTKIKRTLEVLNDQPDDRLKYGTQIMNSLSVDELQTLARTVKENPELIQLAKGFLKAR
jgi:hypothetical protein